MSKTDPIADYLTCIRNATRANHPKVDIPASRLKQEITKILQEEAYIKNHVIINDGKQGVIRIYHDHDFLVSYREADGRHQLVGNRLFYEQLKRDRQQAVRKYGRAKGKATRGLTTTSLFPQVDQRPLAEYDRFAEGGGAWNN